MTADQRSLPDDLGACRQRLAMLDQERSALLRRVSELEGHGQPPRSSTPQTAAEKVALFGTLFAGRKDVFALRWRSSTTGKSGYAPACGNEWQKPLCLKRKIKCAACAHRSLLPLTDKVLLGHLQGRQVVGVYPLRRDGTCSFLAFDLDKRSWREDAVAVRDAALSFDCAPLLERSRSGAGAHVWVFFAEPVSASMVRRLADRILYRAMNSRDRLPLASFDRVFPCQEELRSGGFGNLIALPLQRKAREGGNSEFLDQDLEPVSDPWSLLANVPKMSRSSVEQLAGEDQDERSTDDRSTGTPSRSTPWVSVTKRVLKQPLLGDVRVHVVKANRLYVRRKALPPRALAEVRRLATRLNPDYIRKRRAGIPTYGTARFVSLVEDHANWLGLPRGLEHDLHRFVKAEGGTLSLRDRRVSGEALDLELQGELRPWQTVALDALLKHDTGVLVASPGLGKTVLALALLAKRNVAALVLVHRRSLAEQWQAQIEKFLGLTPRQIGRYGGGRRKLRGRVDVATLQSLSRARNLDEMLAPYGQVFVDECHHVPAESFEAVVGRAPARYVTGLTATPKRRDGLEEILFMHCGPLCHEVLAEESAAPIIKHLVVKHTAFPAPDGPGEKPYATLISDLSECETRTREIANDVAEAVAEGRRILVLTERRKHLEFLESVLRAQGVKVVQLHGGLGVKERRARMEALAPDAAGAAPVVLATGRFAGEGLDLPHLDTLFLALPVSWKGTVAQYVGRLGRSFPGKTNVRVTDYVDDQVPVLARMFERRLRSYRALGYSEDAPLPFGSPPVSA